MNILFIGNSYTFYHDMPELLAALAKENSKELCVDSVTRGGRRLYENLVEGDAEHDRIVELVLQKSYDALFLQEQSYHALVDYDSFLHGVRSLKELVAAKRTILYATWGRKSGSELLEKYGWTSEEMGQKMHEAYSLAAKQCGAEISPVGLAFNAINSADSADSVIELYDSDLSHPSRQGSVLVTVMHYLALFGELPEKYTTLEVDDAVAKRMFEVALRVI